MFNRNYEERLALWSTFRDTLEVSDDPIQEAIDFYKDAPTVSLNADPFDSGNWPTPWELLEWNEYCKFTRVLGIGYSLQLTDCFSGANFEIHTYTHDNEGYVFLLLVDNQKVIGWEEDVWISKDQLPNDLYSKQVHQLPKYQ
jgi:hypothetical protein